MHRFSLFLVGTMAVAACSEGVDPEPDSEIVPPETPARWQAFDIDALKQQRASQGVGFLQFLDEPAVTMGLYHLGAGAVDGQEAHNRDEVYYVVNGVADIVIDGVRYALETGSAVFVRAGADHRFDDITEALDALVIFATSTPDPSDPAGLTYALDDMVASRDAAANVWNPFLGVSTMSLGMYMLPSAVGGDGTLTHAFDEINIVVNGGGRFTMGDDTIDVGPGSIVFVEDAVGHRFHDLSGDTDVLIWWER